MGQISYREMKQGEEQMVCELVHQVFTEFLAAEYGTEGAKEFFKFASPDAMRERVKTGGSVLVASTSHGLAGMLEFAPPDRIAMLFVTLRRQGIAKELLARAIHRARTADPSLKKLTVHSSAYAEPVYRKMGFARTRDAVTDHGITYIPMERDLQRSGPRK